MSLARHPQKQSTKICKGKFNERKKNTKNSQEMEVGVFTIFLN